MKVFALCGSPRKGHNTDQLLDKALAGVECVYPKIKIEKIHIYDYLYTGCVSCYACKRLNGKFYGRCAKKDSISNLLCELSEADGIIVGAPVYFHDIPGQLHAFLERLLYPYLVYGKEYSSIAPRKAEIAIIYTMNATEKKAEEMNYNIKLSAIEKYMGIIFSEPEILCCYDTLQFEDYSKYMSERFSEREKLQRKREHFPKDCEAAYMLGKRLAERIKYRNPTA